MVTTRSQALAEAIAKMGLSSEPQATNNEDTTLLASKNPEAELEEITDTHSNAFTGSNPPPVESLAPLNYSK